MTGFLGWPFGGELAFGLTGSLGRTMCSAPRQVGDFESGAGTVERLPCLSRDARSYVVIASVDGRSVELAGSAVAIWRAIPEPGSPPLALHRLVTSLAAEYDVSLEIAERAVATVVDSLEVAGCAIRNP